MMLLLLEACLLIRQQHSTKLHDHVGPQPPRLGVRGRPLRIPRVVKLDDPSTIAEHLDIHDITVHAAQSTCNL